MRQREGQAKGTLCFEAQTAWPKEEPKIQGDRFRGEKAMRKAKLSVGLTLCLSVLGLITAASANAEFGFTSFATTYEQPLGGSALLAGGHPDMVIDLEMNSTEVSPGLHQPDDQVRDFETQLPAGFYGNPQVAPTCSMAEIIGGEGFCDPA